ncbi:MAG: hypothetical protein ACR2QE_02655 [Acidimicrobiales bacterium]
MTRDDGPVPWSEARELVIGILLAVVGLRVAAAVVGAIDAEAVTGRVRFLVFTNHIGAFEGLVLLLAAVLLCSAPAGTVPRFLRVWIFQVSAILALVAVFGMINVLTLQNGRGGAGKLFSVLQVGLPAAALFVVTAWLAREVVTLPADDH